jgi:hypothetical protein
MTDSDITRTLEAARVQADAIAKNNPESEQIRILAIAIAEIAWAAGEMSKKSWFSVG